MSYNRKTWTNRNSEHPYRRILTDTTSGTAQTVDVTRAEGTVTTEGDVFDANTMNNMEGRIANEFTAVDQKIGDLQDLDTTAKNNLVAAINEVAQGGGGGGSSTLAGLTDTSISNPSNGQVLKYNSTSGKWENAAESGGGSTAHKIIITATSEYDVLSENSAVTVTNIEDEEGTAIADADIWTYLGNGYHAILQITAESPYDGFVSINMAGWNEERIWFNPSAYTKGSTSETGNQYVSYEAKLDNNALSILVTNMEFASQYNLTNFYAPLASPAFTGTPTAPTPTAGDDSQKIATTAFVQAAIDAMSYHKGDTIDLRNSIFAGIFTGGQKSVIFYIPLNKPLASDISSVSLVNTSVEVRHPDGGYIIASNEGGLSDHGTISLTINQSRTGVLVALTLTTADTRYANNTPIAVRCYTTSTITFS